MRRYLCCRPCESRDQPQVWVVEEGPSTSLPIQHPPVVMGPGSALALARLSGTTTENFVAAIANFRFNSRTAQGAHFRLLAARDARGLLRFHPPKIEGAGKAGCALHPRSRVQTAQRKCAHEHTGSAESIRPSLRNGFTAYNVLSPATGFVATVADGYLRQLDASIGASEPHAFAVRIRRARQLQHPRPPHPTARFVTIAIRPSHRVRRRELCPRFARRDEAKYFCPKGLTRGAQKHASDLPVGSFFGQVSRKIPRCHSGASFLGRARNDGCSRAKRNP